jgi:hypothetical protein
MLFLTLWLGACGTPVTVERVDPRTVHRELTVNVLTVGEESGASRIVLHRWNLTERFESDPEGTLAELHAGLPRSIQHMTPGNAFVQALASIPVAPGIAVNSIVAVKGAGPLEKDNDGIVEYTSAHLSDLESELVVRSGHSVHAHPLAIAEVRRILYRHGEEACLSANGCGVPAGR